MSTQRPVSRDDEHRVLKFRPRTTADLADKRKQGGVERVDRSIRHPEPNDLARYERGREEPDDFRHRMLANLAAFAFTVALIGVGIWLAMSIADLRKTQDCVLMGRRDCARISSP